MPQHTHSSHSSPARDKSAASFSSELSCLQHNWALCPSNQVADLHEGKTGTNPDSSAAKEKQPPRVLRVFAWTGAAEL